jgi:DNA primase
MDPQAIQLIKARVGIVDMVRRFVDLRPAAGRWMGVCPFHQETKPSFSVNEQEGFFYCFGCQASGDVIDFYRRMHGLEFGEAIEQLAAEAGVELRRGPVDKKAVEASQRKKQLLEMHELAQTWFRRNLSLSVGAQAREYLTRRGLAPEIVQAFGLGCSPEDWHGLENFLRSKGVAPERAVEAGLLVRSDKGNVYDRFRGRLIFPIQNLSGRVIAFGGRILKTGDEAKYINSSDSPIFKKGEHLYGLPQARQAMARSRRALLTEGYVDVLSLHQFGYKDACGVLGTALTAEQVRRLSGFCSRIDLVFDGDAAGKKAALRGSELILLSGVLCRVVLLPEGEDVDSVLQKQGQEAFERCLDSARDGLSFCLDTLRGEFSPKDRMDWIRRFLDKVPEASVRADYLSRIARQLGLLGVSETEFRRAMAEDSRRRPEAQRSEAATGIPAVGRDEANDRVFLKFCVQHPGCVAELATRGIEQTLATQWGRGFFAKLAAHAGQDVLPWLDEGEKQFWAACRAATGGAELSEDEFRGEWDYIVGKIAEAKAKAGRRGLKEELRQAKEAGDAERVMRCLRALNDSLGRDDEQH